MNAGPDRTVLGGRYRLLERLGSGGHAEVFLAEQLTLSRKVALKVINRSLPVAPEAQERFKREALLHASIEHPAVVKILDFETGGPEGAVVVMEYVDGTPLHRRLLAGPLSVSHALPLLQKLAEGLGAIHRRGVVHRDLKAENVMLTTGPDGTATARILDFGLARLLEAGTPGDGDGRSFVSSHGIIAGTPAYVAPECLRGLPPDPRSDVYAFGVLAHFMLSGALPFPGPEVNDFVRQHLERRPPSLSVPRPLRKLVRRCLEKDPSKRPADGAALADALAVVAPAVLRSVRVRPFLFGLLAVMFVVLGGLVLLERPSNPLTQTRWLVSLGLAEHARAHFTEPASQALFLEALGRGDELKTLLERDCLAISLALEPAERARLNVPLSRCLGASVESR